MKLEFAEFLATAILSLLITFVLFRWLESRAEGESKLLGGSIKYGGALAGFVMVFWLSSHTYGEVFRASASTPIDLAGEFDVQLIRHDGQTRAGTALITQVKGSPNVEIQGEVENDSRPYPIEFHTIQATLHERRLIWVYENEARELGLGMGTVATNRPDRIVFSYADISGADLNADPAGRLVFTRRK
ncbi:MAG TPA: hypothetical protein VFQ45_16430 [Longimicrobium sp.]|nr:hypothetical protein [Longimicrobium sp.]